MGRGGGAAVGPAGAPRPPGTRHRPAALAWGRLQLADATFMAFRMLGEKDEGR